VAEKIQIAVGQISPRLGDFGFNLEKHIEYTRKAKESGADIIVFPELGLTGYQVQDMALDLARMVEDPDIQALVRESLDIDIVFSFIEETKEHLFYISAVYAAHGQITHIHRKVFLPTYGMFDDKRYFASGDSFATFDTRAGSAGLLVCEDAWHTTSPYLLALGGARIAVICAAGPARSVTDVEYFGSQKFWRELLSMYARLHGLLVVFVNRVGVEDGVSFFGGSSIVAPDGGWLLEAPVGQEGLYSCIADMRTIRRARYITPLLRDEQPLMVASELQRIINARKGGIMK
jgi:predicted amidohydrolase